MPETKTVKQMAAEIQKHLDLIRELNAPKKTDESCEVVEDLYELFKRKGYK